MLIHIRKALKSDFLELAAIFQEVRCQVFTWKDSNVFRQEDFYEETKEELILLAEDNKGEIVGFISVWEPDRFIHHLYIKSAFQGYGIGKRLINTLPMYVPFPYHLKCESKNESALLFYTKTGWREIGRGMNGDDEYRVLQLSKP